MMRTIRAAVPRGVEALPVLVEVDSRPGLPSLTVVGLPDAAVREARERVLAAIRHLGGPPDTSNVVVNLSPAEERKEGALLDVAIAVGVLAASGRIPPLDDGQVWFLGELSLDGRLRPVRGVLPIVEHATRVGAAVVLPRLNQDEAAVIRGARLLPAEHLKEIIDHFSGHAPLSAVIGGRGDGPLPVADSAPDLCEVAGQEHAKRALEVAAAGGHHLLLLGPPGAGKTMLAQRLPGILPPLSETEALSTTKVYSVAPGVPRPRGLVRHRPFRAPHHTISGPGLVGGGPVPRPGEISLAHNGVLFLDEITEFRRDVLEVLRQPLESGQVVIARAAATLAFPARVQLVAAANPCPCGHLGDPRRECRCSAAAVDRYRARLSGPLLDRIDLHLEVPAVTYRTLTRAGDGESSVQVRDRVMAARQRQLRRSVKGGAQTNSELTPSQVRQWCSPDREGDRLLELAVTKLALSGRGVHRVLKVARTIADLDGSDRVHAAHVAEAVTYRSLDRGSTC